MVFFYPKASTPGCTQQACALRDIAGDIGDTQIIGVSPDKSASQKKFADKNSLPYPLLADVDHQLAEAFGVWKMKQLYGRSFMSGFPRPADVIAHRAPFLFVDEITALEPGISATGLWRLTGDEWFFAGHFPGRPTLPGVLMCEAIAQVGAIAVLTDPRFAGKLPLFGGLDAARFRRQVVPGDTLELTVELGRMSARAGKGSGKALLNGETACECDLMFVLVNA